MIRIRPYKDSDLETVFSWCPDEDTFYKWTAGVLGPYPITAEAFQKTGELMRFTALDEKEPVGFFTVRNPRDTLEELRFGFVLLDPRKRGKGYGKAMLQLGLKYAFEIYGAETVSLGVFENNTPAYWCYRSAGFRETGTREAYTVNGQQWMAIDMECRKTNK